MHMCIYMYVEPIHAFMYICMYIYTCIHTCLRVVTQASVNIVYVYMHTKVYLWNL